MKPLPQTNDAKVERILQIKKEFLKNIMSQCFCKDYYNSLKDDQKSRFLTCLHSGIGVPDSETGCYAMSPSDYDQFKPFFQKVLEKYHKVDLSKKKHENNWDINSVKEIPKGGILDIAKLGLPPLSMRVRTGRNLKKYPLPGNMTQNDRIQLEKELQQKVFQQITKDPKFGGQYHSLTPENPKKISQEKYNQLVKAHIMFKDMSADLFLSYAGIANHWPYGRGCYVSQDKCFIIWVGQQDHLRIMAMQKGTVLNDVFNRLKSAIDVVQKMIPGGCAYSPDFGVVTSCPTNIGTGMRASVHIALPNLCKDGTENKAKEICRPFGLSVRGLGGEHTPIGKDGTVDISPSSRFCITQAQILMALYKGIEKVWSEQKKLK